MNESRENQLAWKSRDRLVGRLDQMVDSGRLTDDEAERLRAAGEPGEFDDVLRDIRVRHAAANLGAAVTGGSLTQEEADGFLERLRIGDHSRSLRARLRDLRPGGSARAPGRAATSATRNRGGDAHG
ncbi:MAG: hypothetical protein H0U37_02265 [Chloroflexi bacterium]|nr:hypothetical protein [Chloroflexota bacterium]